MSKRSRVASLVLAGIYLTTIIVISTAVRPLSQHALATIVLLPAIAFALAGIPKVMEKGSRRSMVLLHLILYPIAAALALGLPALFVALQIAEQFG